MRVEVRYRADIRDRAALEKNFREKFQALNQVKLTDAEFRRLLDYMVAPDLFTAAHTLRNGSSTRQGERCSGREGKRTVELNGADRNTRPRRETRQESDPSLPGQSGH